ncbi:spermidine synthase [uncultured Micrococcus sp.]|uniref:spermidine synthase n=1 Tax=uncultured Micrococcus sp. TaxID=114051 RepID=UPI002594D05B|nr:spermidine synthase [uncultured Micrococcus sp.]
MNDHRVRTVQLSASGQEAMILPAEFGTGVELAIGGAVQSHVDPDDPRLVRYEYLRRIATVFDVAGAPGAPLRTLHLGAGALTLPRYLQATRPGSEQLVVDLDRELVDFVVGALPLPAGTRLESIVGDARMVAVDLLMEGERFDAVVLDIGTGEDGAEHLRGTEFYTELLGLVGVGEAGDGDLEGRGGEAGGPDEADGQGGPGVLLVNIGDDPGLRFLGTQIRALDEAARAGGPGGRAAGTGSGDAELGVWTLADAGMLERREAGNAVLAVGPGLNEVMAERLRAAGPHPAAVLNPAESRELADRLTG